MSKGMWTKHLSPEGKAFYFNATLNRSEWAPPPESVVHEAQNLVPISGSSGSQVGNPEQPPPVVFQPSLAPAVAPPPPLPQPPAPTYAVAAATEPAAQTAAAPFSNELLQALKNDEMAMSFQAKIDAAVAKRDREVAAKRFAKRTGAAEDSLSQSEYLMQKAELDKLSGGRDDDQSKWLVR